jgi:hypothetical protein
MERDRLRPWSRPWIEPVDFWSYGITEEARRRQRYEIERAAAVNARLARERRPSWWQPRWFHDWWRS